MPEQKQPVTIYVKTSLLQRLDIVANKLEASRNALVNGMLNEYVNECEQILEINHAGISNAGASNAGITMPVNTMPALPLRPLKKKEEEQPIKHAGMVADAPPSKKTFEYRLRPGTRNGNPHHSHVDEYGEAVRYVDDD